MLLKNNSKREWLGYKCVDGTYDILAESTVEVSERDSHAILRNLGNPNWVVKVETELVEVKLPELPKVKAPKVEPKKKARSRSKKK